ncbi:MAG: hypothetical protein KKA81_14500 [Bacteroidetes bacterium]|nr:hypothetical protein [Bacteroidota bacterium]
MLKKLTFILVAAALLAACGGNTGVNQETAVVEETVVTEPVILEVNSFQEKAEGLVGQEITIEGIVVHVCKHGGQKMFITADNPDISVKITPAEGMAAFVPELEGSPIIVKGIVQAIEEEMPAEEEGEGHEQDEAHETQYHKPQYSVSAVEFTIKEAPAAEEPTEAEPENN